MEVFYMFFMITAGLVVLVSILAMLYATFIIVRRRRYSHIPSPPVARCPKLKSNIIILHAFHKSYAMLTGPEFTKHLLTSKKDPKCEIYQEVFGFPCGIRFAGHGLVTRLSYDAWKPRRNLLNPAFHRSYLKGLIPEVNRSVDLLLAKFRRLAERKEEVSLLKEFSKFTMNVISNVACGMPIDTINEDAPLSYHLGNMLTLSQRLIEQPGFKMSPWSWSLLQECKKSSKYLRNTGKNVILSRQAGGEEDNERPDVISYLVQAAEKDSSLDIDDLIDEFVTFFTAGHETTANTLSLVMMELSNHPDVEEKLAYEVSNVLGNKEAVEEDDLAKFSYMGLVIKETLRMYSVVTDTMRTLANDEVYGNYTLPAGTEVTVSFAANSRHPDYWYHPNDFYPERFEREDEKYNPMMLTPFSGGPRNCIGQYFAQMEMKIFLSRFLREFEFKISPGQHGKVTEKFTLRPRDGCMGKLVFRNGSRDES